MHRHKGRTLYYDSKSRRALRLLQSALKSAAIVGMSAWLYTLPNPNLVLLIILAGWGVLDLLRNLSRRPLIFTVGPEGIRFQAPDGTRVNVIWSLVRSFELNRRNKSSVFGKSWINLDDPDKGRHSLRIPLQSLDPDICDQLIAAIQTYRLDVTAPWQQQLAYHVGGLNRLDSSAG
ncbi:MAG: hypothetical protein FalmKO_34940 [Falsiruegeria mediterranea]